MATNIHDRARQLVAQGACVTASEAYSMLAKRRTRKVRRLGFDKPGAGKVLAGAYWWNEKD
jgi:hypothetical protein